MPSTIRSLQACRALAAIAVAAFHLSTCMGLARYGGHDVFGAYTRLGNRGVDFFFVLSGFIILFAHHHDIGKPGAWPKYLYRRFVRLYPIYWLYTFIFALLLVIFGGTDAKLPGNIADWATSLSLIRFTDAAPPLAVAWSLFHEMAFYSLFSILILSRRAGLAILGMFMALALIYHQFPTEDSRTPFNVYTAAYNLYFLFGMGAYWLYRRGGSGFLESGIGLCMTFAALLTIPLPYELSPIFLVSGLAVLLAGITRLEITGYLKIPLFMAFIGDASYTVYLTHVSVEGLLLKAVMKLGLYDMFRHEFIFMLVLAGAVLLGCIAYLVVERPLLEVLRNARTKP